MTSIFDYIRQKKAEQRQAQELNLTSETLRQKEELALIKKEKMILQERQNIRNQYAQEKQSLTDLKRAEPKRGIMGVLQKAGDGVKKLKDEREKFRKENQNFGKPSGIFSDITPLGSTTKVDTAKKINNPNNVFNNDPFGKSLQPNQNLSKEIVKKKNKDRTIIIIQK
jgi:hypothetical protein